MIIGLDTVPSVAGRSAPDHEIVVVGAGLGGIGAGVALQREGIHDFVIVDKWDRVGGAWHASIYPGVAVHIPAFIYCFSYEQRSDWSRIYAPGDELRDYADTMVDKYGLREKLRMSTTIVAAVFDECNSLWRLTTDAGAEITARYVVFAYGEPARPKIPDIAGIDVYDGPLLHPGLWDHDVQLSGKRVAVIGTGATAAQLVPAIVDEVAHLTVFQCNPIWVLPKKDVAITPAVRAILRNGPLRSLLRLAGTLAMEFGMHGTIAGPRWLNDACRRLAAIPVRRWMRKQVDDPVTREKLVPKYGLGRQRPAMSDDYLATFNRGEVSLVTDPIECITSLGVRTADGVEHEVDVLVCGAGSRRWGTGSTPPFPVLGCGGLDLGAFWREHGVQSYQGVSVPGFPNMFTVTKPYGGVPGSYVSMIEAASAHIGRTIAEAKKRRATAVEIQRHACGDLPFRPGTHGEMRWKNRHFDLNDYRYTAAAAAGLTLTSAKESA